MISASSVQRLWSDHLLIRAVVLHALGQGWRFEFGKLDRYELAIVFAEMQRRWPDGISPELIDEHAPEAREAVEADAAARAAHEELRREWERLCREAARRAAEPVRADLVDPDGLPGPTS